MNWQSDFITSNNNNNNNRSNTSINNIANNSNSKSIKKITKNSNNNNTIHHQQQQHQQQQQKIATSSASQIQKQQFHHHPTLSIQHQTQTQNFYQNNNNNINNNNFSSNNNNQQFIQQNMNTSAINNNNSTSPSSNNNDDNNLASSSPNKSNLIAQTIDLIRRLKLKIVCFDFDCTIVTIHTGGQWLDSPEKLAEFVRPCFRELLPALLHTPGLHVCVVTYSPQEQLIREVLRISMKEESAVNDMVKKIIIKGNTKEFLQQYGIEYCFSNGKQIHIKYCRNYFESVNFNAAKALAAQVEKGQNNEGNGSGNSSSSLVAANNANTTQSPNRINKENLIEDSSIFLIDDDVQNLKLAYENGHLVFQVQPTMKLFDMYSYLKERLQQQQS